MTKLIRNKIYKSNFQRIREDLYRKKNNSKLKKSKEHVINPLIIDNSPNKKDFTLIEHLCRIRTLIEHEGKNGGEQTSIEEGFVYLITNPVWNGWVKVGMTTDYESRLSTYNIYDPTSSYSFVDIKWTIDRKYAEKHLKNVFSIHSSGVKGEWFKITLEKAKVLMQTTV